MTRNNSHVLTLKELKDLFDSLYGSLCLFANSYLNNTDTSKDIVQEVFIKIWEDRISFQNENTRESFLYTSVRNRSLNYLKSKHYRVTDNYPLVDIEKLETEEFFLDEFLIINTSTILEKAIGSLPDKCSRIIRLSIKGYANSEIADEMAISINTVRAHKRTGYQKLRNVLNHSKQFLYFFLMFY